MGLDVYAYKAVKRTEMSDDDFFEKEPDKHIYLMVHPEFPGHANPLSSGVYSWEEVFCFGQAYSAHTRFRNNLAKLAGYEPFGKSELRHFAGAILDEVKEGPFWELINFADNEGVIGTDFCKKLAKDFDDFQEKAESVQDDIEFRTRYHRWRQACHLAAQDGCLDFR